MSVSHATVESRASGGLSGSGHRGETDTHQDSAKADETNQKSFASQGDQGFDNICGLKKCQKIVTAAKFGSAAIFWLAILLNASEDVY
jgi:hypothetical protein